MTVPATPFPLKWTRDKADNEVQGSFTSHKEGNVETLEGGAVDPEAAEGGAQLPDAESDATSGTTEVSLQQ